MRKIISSFLRKVKELFCNNKIQYDLSEYKSHDEISQETINIKFSLPEVPDNGKINLVIMDDNDAAGEITKKEIIKLSKIAEKINKSGLAELTSHNSQFIRKLSNMQLIKLTKLKLDDYNIIMCTGKMAAFKVIGLLENGVKIDKGFLDIVIGGYNEYKGKNTILDGIDVANEILKINPTAKVIFYSGCSLDDDSTEYEKGKRILNKDIRDMILSKDNDSHGKKIKLIEFMVE